MKLPVTILFIFLLLLYGCFVCEEVEDFYWSGIRLTILDADTGDNLLEVAKDDLLETEFLGSNYPIQLFRNGDLDSTSLTSHIQIDDWELEKFFDENHKVNTDTMFTIRYEIHFLKDTIMPDLINVDTIDISYSIYETDCNVIGIHELSILYNHLVIQEGGIRRSFFTARI